MCNGLWLFEEVGSSRGPGECRSVRVRGGGGAVSSRRVCREERTSAERRGVGGAAGDHCRDSVPSSRKWALCCASQKPGRHMECLTAPPTNRMPVFARPQLIAPALLTSGNNSSCAGQSPMGIRSLSCILLHSQCVGSAFQRLGESHL